MSIESLLKEKSYNWLLTGVAGFIGSNILECLLENNQRVIGIDNFSTGSKKNLNEIQKNLTSDKWDLFTFIEGDISNFDFCKTVTNDIDYVLHQAALGSVPRSINDPLNTNNSNVTGFLNLIVASRDSKVNSLVYAASSSTYGDHPALPKVEHIIGKPLSTYAVTKYINELYADVFARNYDFRSVGLRYFNVFGKMQNPQGPYAAVIPRWIEAMIKDSEITIFGDGETSRDFCYIKNVVQANILAAFSEENVLSEVYNVAVGDRTTLNQLFEIIKNNLLENEIQYKRQPVYSDFRDGDVRHSQADISKAEKFLGYNPQFTIDQGIKDSINWYIQNLKT